MATIEPAPAIVLYATILGLAINLADFTLSNRIGKTEISSGRLLLSVAVPATAIIFGSNLVKTV